MEVIWKALAFFAIACSVTICVRCQETAKENANRLIESHFSVVSECGVGESCVRFCCKNESSCADPDFFDLRSVEMARDLDSNYKIIKGLPPCAERDEVFHFEEEWKFSRNGTVEYVVNNVTYIETQHTYCFENNGTEVLLVCFEPAEEVADEISPVTMKKVYPFLMLISVPFLMATFCVYLCIPDLRNLHGKCLMCYLFGLTCLFLSFPLIQLNHDSIQQTRWLCEATGYAAYVSILVCFFFLNVMCYDIYSTFSGIQNSLSVRRAFANKGNDNRRFLNYCLYAFGLPVLIASFVFALDHFTSIPDQVKIRMGHGRCWLKQEKQIEFLYVYFPMACLLLINLIFYSITAYKIFQVQKQTKTLLEGENKRNSRINSEKTRFFLYLRLFVIMGVPWSIDIASWAMKDSPFLHAADILNCLQGVVIFILFVWKPKIKKLVIRRISTAKMTSSASLSSRKCSKTEMFSFSKRKDSELSNFSSRKDSMKHVQVSRENSSKNPNGGDSQDGINV